MPKTCFIVILAFSLLPSGAGCGGRTGLLELRSDSGASPDLVPSCTQPAVVEQCDSQLCKVLAGCFTMGSPKSEACRYPTETAHKVTLTRGFSLSRREVTQEQFLALMGYNPSYFKACGGECPVEQVNWHEAAGFCNALSAKQGLASCYTCKGALPGLTCETAPAYRASGKTILDCPGYRLPTEAEWEYAYRAGTLTHYYSGDLTTCTGESGALGQIAWYNSNSANQTHPTGKKTQNGWGLYDMSGNVWEWTNDWWIEDLGEAWATDPVGPGSGSFPVVRGGGWQTIPGDMRAAARDKFTLTSRYSRVGFRYARTTTP